MKVGFKLDNIRIGFATNSSSSHSIILTKKDFEFTEDMEDNSYVFDINNSDIMELEFNNIVTNEVKTKIGYFIMGFLYNYSCSRDSDDPLVQTLMNFEGFKKLIKSNDINLKKLIEKIELNYEDIYLNRFQDILDFDKLTSDEHEGLFKAIINDFILNKNVGFLIDNESGISRVLKEFILKDVILRYKNGYLYYYNENNGLKIRFERTDSLDKKQILIPDLVDLKITDRCNYNCEFCYQGSTKNGCETTLEEQLKIVKYLDKLNVFEIAVAGGDPTEQFNKLISACKKEKLSITLNTTTKNYKRGFEIIEQNLDNKNFGAIGFSITNMNELNKFSEFDFSYIPFNKRAIQFCPAFFQTNEIKKIINYAIEKQIRLVVLGYKKIGRGLDYKIKNKEYIKDLVELVNNENKKTWEGIIDFDQVILDEIPESFKNKLLSFSYNFEEGESSMYLDLVTKKLGLSSYDGKFLPFDLNDYEEFRKQLNYRYFLLKE